MLLFSFVLLVLLLISYCGFRKNGKILPIIVSGVLSAILVCSFKTLFLFSHRIVPYSFGQNYIYLLFRQTIIPVIVLYAVFCLISKDSLEYKINAFFPLELSFFAVFLPHIIISTSEGLYSGFTLFVKPVLYACMLIQLGIFFKWFYQSLQKKQIVLQILFVIGGLIFMSIPALLEALCMIKIQMPIVIAGSVIYPLIPITLIVMTGLKKIRL